MRPLVSESSERKLAVILAAVLALVTLLPLPVSAVVTFTHGVASGDVTPFSALLWTRAETATSLTVEVSTTSNFGSLAFRRQVATSVAHDFTAKVLAAPLRPDTVYHYRWRHGSSVSEVGTFKTAPLPWVSADVRFGWSGDTDGVRQLNGEPFFNDFEALDTATGDGLDFFIYLGDTIYSDSPLLPPALHADTLDEYRAFYKANRDYPALKNLLRSTSTYAVWDDHEVRNDYDVTVDPALYAAGRQAFREYMPVIDIPLPSQACVGHPMFKVFRWGAHVDLIVLDTHSCRSQSAAPACPLPAGFLFPTDPLPTLPDAFRPPFGGFTTPTQSPTCLAAINDPSRTLLGSVQKALLKAALRHSTATVKFVISPSTIAQTLVTPLARWEGYAAERREVLEFIRDHGIQNVIFLSTDDHRNLIIPVLVDLFADPTPVALEFVTGPIAAFTDADGFRFFFGPGKLSDAAIAANNALLDIAGAECRNTDAYSYGVVEVSAAGAVTVTLKDAAGGTILSEQAGNAPCVKSLTP